MLTWSIFAGNTNRKGDLSTGFGLVVFGWILQLGCCFLSLVSFREFSTLNIGS